MVKNTMYRFRPQSTWWSAKGDTFQAYPFTQVITRRRYVFLILTPLNLKVPTIMTICGGMTQGSSRHICPEKKGKITEGSKHRQTTGICHAK
jgi:hypothetical protein